MNLFTFYDNFILLYFVINFADILMKIILSHFVLNKIYMKSFKFDITHRLLKWNLTKLLKRRKCEFSHFLLNEKL